MGTGCEICVDKRCPMEAIEMVDDIAHVIDKKCTAAGYVSADVQQMRLS